MHSTLKKQIEDENIILTYSEMNNEVLGCYHSIDGLDLIMINESIIPNTKQLNCVIAEELGHYFTTHGNYAPYSSNEYDDRINHNRVEVRAMKWAVDFLVPTNDILKYISIDYEIDHIGLSDHFEVTKDFIMKKFYYMSLAKNMYHISDSNFLVLSNYPNVFIYEDYERRLSDGIHSKTS